jgi:LmbE family N-acetylglucosaminyl deacetylase
MPVSRRSDIDALNAPFMRSLLAPGRPSVKASNVAVVVAHPDDETIGCGALLGRMEGVTVILVTDGAPLKLAHAERLGFASNADYAAHRAREIHAALSIAGVPERNLLPLAFGDQEAAFNLAPLTRRLAEIFAERGIGVALTHVYEGGHPDHDAVAFACHAAARLLAPRQPILIVEMPFYRLGEAGTCYQYFPPQPDDIRIILPLDLDERRRKHRMLAAHDSQKTVLAAFQFDSEHFRPARPCDFSELPNGGRLLYETFGWDFDGARWRDLACTALGKLGLETRA